MRRNAMGTLSIVTRTASRFVAVAGLLIAANACTGDETATGPQRQLEQPTKPVLDLQPTGLTLFAGYTFLPFTLDVGGVNDYNGQNDINQLSRADNSGKFGVAWTWDDINAWTGTGQSGDVCTLFDTDASGAGAGNADYALCVRINNPGGDPNVIAQLPQPESPILWECSDKKTDRCTTTIISKPLGTTFCEVLKTTTDAFPGLGDDGADVMAACGVDLAAIGTPSTIKLLNICSFPSGSPNSNPFDCILVAGSGYLKIVKKTTPDDSKTAFSFLLKDGPADAGTTHGLTDSKVGDEESALIVLDPTKTYSLEETSVAGWALGAAACTGGSTTVTKTGNVLSNIKINVGQTVTCTFENVQNGSITIVKDAKPDATQDFSYTVTGTGLGTFDLDDDGDNTNTLSNSKSFNSLGAGKRTITETATTGWKVTGIACTGQTTSVVKYGVGGGSYTNTTYVDGDNSVEIDLVAGENVSCTFDNTKLGSVTIKKEAVPNHADDFSFTSTELGSFTLDDDADVTRSDTQLFPNLQPGERTVTEGAAAGWTLTDISCSGATNSVVTIGASGGWNSGDTFVKIDVKDGENVTCTFTNTRHGSITIVKDAVPNNDQDFSFTTTNLAPATFDLDDDGTAVLPANSKVFSGLLPDTYGVAEDGESGWALTSISCPGTSNATIGASSVSIALAAGENVTCTFTNTQGGSITIVKDAVPDHAQDFSFATTGAGLDNPFSLDDDAVGPLLKSQQFSGLQPGLRTITENDVAGWTITNITCTGKASSTVTIGAAGDFNAGDKYVSIDLAAGENITCTFVNTAPPTVNVEKTVLPTSVAETGGNVTYSIVVTNTSPIDVTLSSLIDNKFTITGAGECIVPANHILAPGGTYSCSFTRTLPAGEALGTYVNEATATVTNAGGQGTDKDDATVTYTNVNPNISVTKVANPTSLSTVQAGVLTFPNPDRTFTSNPNPPAPGSPNFASPTCDDGGANDINSAQVDLNCFNRADNVANKIHVKWTWDDIDEWGGGGSTGDGCALLDTDNDGNVNVAICARIQNDAQGNVVQIGGSGAADVYLCNDTKVDRCSKPVSQVTGTGKGLTSCTIGIVDDGFGGIGSDHSTDVEATCSIDRLMTGAPIPAAADLLNVCSFPSGEPNSNPFDCVVQAGAGFIQIVKVASPTTTTQFGFTLAGLATDGSSKYIVAGGISSALIPVTPSGGQVALYSLTETQPTNWSLSSVSCSIDGVATGTSNVALSKITAVEVKTGQTTICTFNNTGQISGSVEYTVRVTNNGLEAVTLFSLTDDKFASITPCASGGTILGGEYYECTFTKTISGAPGTSHVNEITAVAKDNEGNSDTKKATATVNFVSPP